MTKVSTNPEPSATPNVQVRLISDPQGSGESVERRLSPVATPVPNYNFNSLLPGQFGGLVQDQTGAVVPNARVTVTSIATGVVLGATANQSGMWQVMGVPSGEVKIRVESPGFKAWEQSASYDANRPRGVSTTLSVSAATEMVEVTSESSLVDLGRLEREAKKQADAAQNAPSSNVFNLQRRVAGVLPVAADVPPAGIAFHFVRPLVVDEETKVTFVYRSK